ncbi:ankyrin repeat domain-containing protein [Bacillus mycoides]
METVEFLLHYGANIEAKDKTVRTPLFQATICGHKNIVELLIKKAQMAML